MKYGSKNPSGLKKYLTNLTELLENPGGLLCQCALPWANPWGLNETKNQRGMSSLHTHPYGVYGAQPLGLDLWKHAKTVCSVGHCH